MRIGHKNNYLSFLKAAPSSPYSSWKFDAVSSNNGRIFTASHDLTIIPSPQEAYSQFKEFSDLKTDQIKIILSEGGWLQLERDKRGYITVSYRLADYESLVAMEGSVLVEGEYANAFCREFGALLKP